MTSHPTYCLTCQPDRHRLPRRGLVCDACRSWLAGMLTDLPGLVDELLVRELSAGVGRRVDADNLPTAAVTEPLSALLPAATVTSGGNDRITGTKERSAPLSSNVIDLTSNPRYGDVYDSYGDQIGERSVLTVLDLWVRDVRRHRARSEHLPVLTVDRLVGWLTVRLDDTCDTYPRIGDLAASIRHTRGAIRAQLGYNAPEADFKEGVYCPKCDHQELWQRAGNDRVECGNCPNLLTIDEYTMLVTLSARNLIQLHGAVCGRCGRDQMYRWKGTAMPHCGWCDYHTLTADQTTPAESSAA
jgi:Zn ribbon nucleic-acid-binding protein